MNHTPEEAVRLGNAGEPADMSNAWIARVEFDKHRDFDLILALAEALGRDCDTLDEL